MDLGPIKNAEGCPFEAKEKELEELRLCEMIINLQNEAPEASLELEPKISPFSRQQPSREDGLNCKLSFVAKTW